MPQRPYQLPSGELRALEIVHRGRNRGRVLRRLAELRQHRHTARGDVLGRRIEQGAVVGERNVVEIVVFVVGVERAPAAVPALQVRGSIPARARSRGDDRSSASTLSRAIHRQRHHGGVVDVGIMRVGVLERPAAGAHMRPPRDPVAAARRASASARAIAAPWRPAAAPRRRRSPAAHGTRARYPRSARRKAGNRPRLHARPAASRRSGAPPPAADDPADSPARRTSSRCSPSPERSRRGRPRR